MFPLLLKLGPISIHSYGLMIALGFFAAVSTVRRLSSRNGLDPQQMADFAFWFLVVGFIGGRMLFVITRWEDYSNDLLGIFRIWEGGLVFFGGPLAGIPFAIWILRKNRISFWKALDIFMPAVAVAHALGRVGCLAAGCCYGKPTDLPWGIRLSSDLVDVSHRGIPLHPVQLYESTALLILYFGLLWIFSRRKFDGQVGLTYLLVYPILRSILETFRGDSIRGFLVQDLLSTSQFISAVIFVVAMITLLLRVRSVHSAPQGRS